MMKRLYFVRHGESEGNAKRLFAGATDTPLTKEGRAQARAAGKSARALDIDCIVSSPLKRALDTAKIIATAIGYPEDGIHINNLFVERHFGEMEGKPWHPDLDLDGIADIETIDSIVERARLAHGFLHTLDARNILVVSHGSFGRALRSIILPEYEYRNRTAGGAGPDSIPNAEIVCWVEEN